MNIADLSALLPAIKAMVDSGQYFSINSDIFAEDSRQKEKFKFLTETKNGSRNNRKI